MNPDLNVDLGEGESMARTRAFMRSITSANVACGGHAGNAKSMTRCIQLAAQYDVRLGAHPGLAQAQGFGRNRASLSPADLERLVSQQVGTLDQLARAEGVALHHVKLHGTLYHLTESDAALRGAYLHTVRRSWPDLGIYALAGGKVIGMARRLGLPVWEELFADRGYLRDGSLLPRGTQGALITRPHDVAARLRLWIESGVVLTVDGIRLKRRAQTWCVHSDTPGALALVRVVAQTLSLSVGSKE